MKKVSFLFGAGAEICFDMPSGNRFALDIFLQDTSEAKYEVKTMLKRVSKDQTNSNYKNKWFPPNFENRSIFSFNHKDFENIIRDTIQHKRREIINMLSDFNKLIEDCSCPNTSLNTAYSRYSVSRFDEDVEEITGIRYKNPTLTSEAPSNIDLKTIETTLNNSRFSSLISVYDRISMKPECDDCKGYSSDNEYEAQDLKAKSDELKTILIAILQLFIGSFGQNIINDLNDNMFKNSSKNPDFFNDLQGIFRIDYSSVGVSGFEYLHSHKSKGKTSESYEYRDNPIDNILHFSRYILETIYSRVLDYKTVIDRDWHFLYYPKDQWAKFCKISVFLLTVRNYIKSQYQEADSSTPSYYSDLVSALKSNSIGKCKVFTTNYTPLLYDNLTKGFSEDRPPLINKEDIVYLNGSIKDDYDPFLNCQCVEGSPHYSVPLLFTQSGTKPMTSVMMLKRYMRFLQSLEESDIICIIGYGFNQDDEHINGIIRTVLSNSNKKLIVIEPNASNKSPETIAKSLRIPLSSRIQIIKVNPTSRQSNNKLWIDYLN